MKMNDTKNEITDVLINGKVYSLSGADSAYIQKVAAFLNRKTAEIKTTSGYNHLSDEYRSLLLELNICDEYFKALNDMSDMRERMEEMERELYSVKHDIVGTRMKLEAALKQQEVLEKRSEEWKQRYEELRSGETFPDEDEESTEDIITIKPKAQ
ncbi:MAG TPA: cell division protein ZapA [Candidatus Avilachnospira avistercoris]|nr:cell division protein ZapA [Candidatus Avilachnospira avistercoris]